MQPSRTALIAAGFRAAHQLIESGSILSDPLAIRILGPKSEAEMLRTLANPSARRGLRLFVVVRARFAEDALGSAVERGVRQLVVLGAGLDTYAYRTTLTHTLRIFEVDHPATQEWKRRRLAAANIALPSALTFAPVDFERESLAHGLTAAGFDPQQRTFFTWLGVVPYLTEDAIFSTLGFIANNPGGAEVVFDYANPPRSLDDPRGRRGLESIAARTAELGEVIKTYFPSAFLTSKLAALGFRETEDLGSAEIAARYPQLGDSFQAPGGHIVHAATR